MSTATAGLGAAMTLPAALSILTTSFKEGKDRNTALGVWGAVGGLASASRSERWRLSVLPRASSASPEPPPANGSQVGSCQL